MNKGKRHGLRALLSWRALLSLLLVLLVCSVGAVSRQIEIASFFQPVSAEARSYFQAEYVHSGGVVPRGTAEFVTPTGVKLPASRLRLVILDRLKLKNNRADFDAIGIQVNGFNYELSLQDDLLLPLMDFVKRGSYSAYTYPLQGYDETYFEANKLVPTGEDNHYVAKEFKAAHIARFLKNLDLEATVEALPPTFKQRIMADLNQGTVQNTETDTWVNADFHIKYQVFLDETDGKKVADVGGLPLRYYWDVGARGRAAIRNVEIFTFPTRKYDQQYRSVLFFQAAAILRQFHRDNKPEFNRFHEEVRQALN